MTENELNKCPLEGFEISLEKCKYCEYYYDDECQYPNKNNKK